ncbi:nucleotide sugar dehydrogenase [Paenibacillus tritici]|uniref:nucleotide sugar dehydrogenase n=1 Tax=Paenibacillus tritici TaxID=1873425 RepID=UPI001BA7C117|nr:nucleotide sugar dehydrogenase [Paenibacillus tritici]QUL53899.1 nucleotide sugar dehydrogenase [Paenibacillus tritici]
MLGVKVNVIGMGYIGLPTALMFAANCVEVIGTDYDEKLIAQLMLGKVTFEEEGLTELFEKAVSQGIKFSTSYHPADIYIVAVPTPYDKTSKKIDARYVLSALKSIMEICPKGAIIVIESTVSPGTINKFICPLIEKNGLVIGEDVQLVHAPERIIPGNMIYELENNSRTIGSDNNEIGMIVKELYKVFCKGEIVLTDIRTAEMTKVIENTFRDINIAFANELTKICGSDDMDVYEIIRIANMHPRVNILQPGPGVGGHCISVDPWFLVGDYPDLTNLILAARKINDSMPQHVLKRIRDIMKNNCIRDISRVGLYGLTYKEDVDDIRESPTLQLLEKMDEHLAFGIKVFDPMIKKVVVENQEIDFGKFLSEIDILVIMVSHSHIKDNMHDLKDKLILDTKNVCHFEGVYKL